MAGEQETVELIARRGFWLNIRKNIFTIDKQWNTLLRETVVSPSLEFFKVQPVLSCTLLRHLALFPSPCLIFLIPLVSYVLHAGVAPFSPSDFDVNRRRVRIRARLPVLVCKMTVAFRCLEKQWHRRPDQGPQTLQVPLLLPNKCLESMHFYNCPIWWIL